MLHIARKVEFYWELSFTVSCVFIHVHVLIENFYPCTLQSLFQPLNILQLLLLRLYAPKSHMGLLNLNSGRMLFDFSFLSGVLNRILTFSVLHNVMLAIYRNYST